MLDFLFLKFIAEVNASIVAFFEQRSGRTTNFEKNVTKMFCLVLPRKKVPLEENQDHHADWIEMTEKEAWCECIFTARLRWWMQQECVNYETARS